jgi:hypothetical protein
MLVGALSITQEYRHKTITQTFLAEPRRWLVLAAKMVAALPMGLAYGLICLVATVLPAAGVMLALHGDPGLGQAATWEFLSRALLDFTLWAPLGVGLGALLTNQVALIVVVLAETQFAEPLIRLVAALIGEDWWWPRFLPGAAGDAIQGESFYSAMTSGGAPTLPLVWASLVMAAWAVGLGAIGYAARFRRDVT